METASTAETGEIMMLRRSLRGSDLGERRNALWYLSNQRMHVPLIYEERGLLLRIMGDTRSKQGHLAAAIIGKAFVEAVIDEAFRPDGGDEASRVSMKIVAFLAETLGNWSTLTPLQQLNVARACYYLGYYLAVGRAEKSRADEIRKAAEQLGPLLQQALLFVGPDARVPIIRALGQFRFAPARSALRHLANDEGEPASNSAAALAAIRMIDASLAVA